MAEPDQLSILKTGANAWNAWREQNPNVQIDLSDTALENIQLQGANLQGADFSGSVLVHVNFRGATLPNARFIGSTLDHINFRESDLRKAGFDSASLSTVFLEGACLQEARLRCLDLRGCFFNRDTDMAGAKVEEATIELYQLRSMREFGGISSNALSDMIVEDDLASLRESFSGFWTQVHLASLVLFVAPYLTFLVDQWFKAEFVSTGAVNTTPLWLALLKYIFSGGQHWGDGWEFSGSFLLFLWMLGFNIFRSKVVFVTKQLELNQEVYGIPAKATEHKSLVNYVRRKYKWLAMVTLVVALVNTAYFLTKRVPTNIKPPESSITQLMFTYM